jgi:hypothetical protein
MSRQSLVEAGAEGNSPINTVVPPHLTPTPPLHYLSTLQHPGAPIRRTAYEAWGLVIPLQALTGIYALA